MPTIDPRIDAYIGEAAAFAKPILTHLRTLIHRACPEVEETMKWSFPHFMHRGMLCSMAAFKQHCAFGFWKGVLIFPHSEKDVSAMGHFGRISSLADLPSDAALTRCIKEAVRLNEAGTKRPTSGKDDRQPPIVAPDYFLAALRKNKRAQATFEGFSPSHKREYIEWITEAKREATRQKRILTALEWLAEGKARNWKYANC